VNKWVWEGMLKVISKGEECIIRLEDKKTGLCQAGMVPVIPLIEHVSCINVTYCSKRKKNLFVSRPGIVLFSPFCFKSRKRKEKEKKRVYTVYIIHNILLYSSAAMDQNI
jgi:hypothetical protein